MSHELDELSRTLGKIEAQVKNVKEHQETNFPLLHEKINDVDLKVARLEIKAGIWGALSGLLTAMGVYLLAVWKKFL